MAKLTCPVCKKRLFLLPTMHAGDQVGCVNCNSVLKITKRNPDKLEAQTEAATLNPDSKPESYA